MGNTSQPSGIVRSPKRVHDGSKLDLEGRRLEPVSVSSFSLFPFPRPLFQGLD